MEDKFISSELSSDSPTSTETLSETKNSSSSTLTLEKALEAGLQSKIDVIRRRYNAAEMKRDYKVWKPQTHYSMKFSEVYNPTWS